MSFKNLGNWRSLFFVGTKRRKNIKTFTNSKMLNLNVGTGAGGSLSAPIPEDTLQADIRKDLVGVDVCCDLEHLPFQNGIFENVYCIHVLEHLSNPAKGLKELIRVCKGVVEIEVPHRFGKQAKAPTHVVSFSCSWFTQCLKNYTYSLRTPWNFLRHIAIHVWIYPHLKKGIKRKNKTLVVDLDNTLFKPTLFSKFCFKLANRIFLLGLKTEKLNEEIKHEIRNYNKKIILSGRANDWMKQTTMEQLKKHQISVDKVLLCPRGDLYLKWKKEQITNLRREHPNLVWEDDDL